MRNKPVTNKSLKRFIARRSKGSRRRPTSRTATRPYLFDNLPEGAIGLDRKTGEPIFLTDGDLKSYLTYQTSRLQEASSRAERSTVRANTKKVRLKIDTIARERCS